MSLAAPTTPAKRRVIQLHTPEKSPKSLKRTLSSAFSISSILTTSPYSPTKSMLRRSATSEIVGRLEEMDRIRSFIASDEGVLFICGPPGTGKTATVTQVITTLGNETTSAERNSFKLVSLNCIESLTKPDAIYAHVLQALDQEGRSLAKLRDYIEILDSQGQELVLVLDEIDYLTTKDSKVIYALFELSRTSSIKLIGIANSLNLTDSMLPLLRKSGIEPSVLGFKPYTHGQITAILSSRVANIKATSGAAKVVEQSALNFLGLKIVNATGDIRKALDILRKSVEVVESEYRSTLSCRSVNTNEPEVKPVTIKHVSEVAAQALSRKSGLSSIEPPNLHEKAILCAIMVRKTQTIPTTFDAYVELCNRDRMLSPLARHDFNVVVSGMMDKGMLSQPTRGKQVVKRSHRKRTWQQAEERIVLGLRETDVLEGIGELGMLKRFFDK